MKCLLAIMVCGFATPKLCSADASSTSDTKSQVTDLDHGLETDEMVSVSESETHKIKTEKVAEIKQTPSKTESVQDKMRNDDELNKFRVKYRSQTFAFNAGHPERSKTFLGIKVEQELQRKQLDRKGRREKFGDITLKKTQQYGKLCSPFQALAVPTVLDIKIPDNMPLSSRMMNKGYTSNNLTEDKLMSMDFGYGGRESPAGEQGETAVLRKPAAGSSSRVGTREDKSQISNRTTVRMYAPVLKKHHTVA